MSWEQVLRGHLRVTEIAREGALFQVELGAWPSSEGRAHALTERQARVVELVAKGATNAEIGDALDVSEASAGALAARALSRLGLGRREQTVVVRAALGDAAAGYPLLPAARVAARAEVLSKLSPCQCEVALLAIAGHPNLQIASMRGTSPGTVANQLVSVFRRLGLSGRATLAARLLGVA